MTKPLSLVGKRFGKLSIVRRNPSNKHGQTMWVANCDCGKQIVCSGNHLVKGHTKSCGCLSVEKLVNRSTTHGQGKRNHRTKAYKAWKEMKRRVLRDPDYTSRGIGICAEWVDSFENFYRDMGDCPENFELDRFDFSKGYLPDNCRWATETTQSRNRSFCKLDMGEAEAIRSDSRRHKEIAKDYGISVGYVSTVKTGKSWK